MSDIQEQNVNQVVLASELDNIVVTPELIKSEDFSKKYQSLEELINYLTAIKKTINESIQSIAESSYQDSGDSSIRSKDYIFTYIAPSTKATFDSKKLKEENPELYAKYVKVNKTASSLRVTKRKKEEKKEDTATIVADFQDIDF